MSQLIQFKRGAYASLPQTAAAGEPLFCTDSGELYIGTGTGIVPVVAKIVNGSVKFASLDSELVNNFEQGLSDSDVQIPTSKAVKTVTDSLDNAINAVNNDLGNALETERIRAIAAEEVVAADLVTETGRATTAEGVLNDKIDSSVTTLNGTINTEKTRAEGIEAGLQTAINTEKTRAEGIEAGLASDIGDVAGDLATETARALAAELALSNAISTSTGMLDTDSTLAANSDEKIASQKAVKTYVDTAVVNLVNASPAVLDTLKELADAIGDDENFAVTVATNIAAETTRAEGVEDALSTRITNEKNRAETAEAGISSNLTDETNRAVGAEAGLQTAITDETTRAQGVENDLQTAIDTAISTLHAEVVAEAGLRSDDVDGLNSRIDTETSDARAAEGVIAGNLVTETNRAIAAEDALELAISDEQTRAEGIEANLNTAIGNEVTRATGAETALDARIDAIEGGALNETAVQDIVGGMVVDSNSIDFTYTGHTLTADVKADSITKEMINSDVAGAGLAQNVNGSLEVVAGFGIQVGTAGFNSAILSISNLDNAPTFTMSGDVRSTFVPGVSYTVSGVSSETSLNTEYVVASTMFDGTNTEVRNVTGPYYLGGISGEGEVTILPTGAGVAVKLDGDSLAVGSLGLKVSKVDADVVNVSNLEADNFKAGVIETELVGSPTSIPTAQAVKNYVDMIAQGLDPKAPVRVATTEDIVLNGLQTIDEVAVNVGDRVLVWNQTNAIDNGVYVVADGSWTRSLDFDDVPDTEIDGGEYVMVQEGTKYQDCGFILITNSPVVVGTQPLVFQQFTGAGQLVEGSAISKDGNIVSVKFDNDTIGLDGLGQLEVKDTGIVASKLNSNVAGVAITMDGSTNALNIVVDDSTMKVNAFNQLYVNIVDGGTF